MNLRVHHQLDDIIMEYNCDYTLAWDSVKFHTVGITISLIMHIQLYKCLKHKQKIKCFIANERVSREIVDSNFLQPC